MGPVFFALCYGFTPINL